MDPRAILRRGSERAGSTLVRRPGLVRGHVAASLAQRQLAGLLTRDPARGATVARSMLRSTSDEAAVVAVRATRGTSVLDPQELLTRASRTGVSAALRVAAAAALNLVAPDSVAVLLAAAPFDSATTALREVARQATDGRGLGELAQEHAGDPAVLEVLALWARGTEPVADLCALARVVLAAGRAVPPDSRVALAQSLRAVGDLTLSTRLATEVTEERGADPVARTLARTGRSMLGSLENGWSPTPVGPRVAGGTVVPYLLHSALPQVSMGYATRTHGLLTALRADGWAVEGFTRPGFPLDLADAHDARGVDVVDGVPYHHLLDGTRTFPVFPVDPTVRTYADLLDVALAGRTPALVHAASNYRNGAAAVAAARRYGVPAVYEVRGLWEYTRVARQPDYAETDHFALLARLEADVAASADRVLTITHALKDVLVERGVDADRVAVVPNGVDTSRFVPRERDDVLAASLGLTGRTVVGYVGSLLEYEGLDLLVEAAAELRRERDDFAVLVVGDGRSLPGLRARAAALGAEEVVVFTGRVPHADVERYYSVIDIAPFPRLPLEVCELVSPLKPFEAMATGKLVIASDVAALAEIVDDGATGRLFAKGSAESLRDVLRETLDDHAERVRMAASGLEWVRDERDWARLSTLVADVYQDLGVEVPRRD